MKKLLRRTRSYAPGDSSNSVPQKSILRNSNLGGGECYGPEASVVDICAAARTPQVPRNSALRTKDLSSSVRCSSENPGRRNVLFLDELPKSRAPSSEPGSRHRTESARSPSVNSYASLSSYPPSYNPSPHLSKRALTDSEEDGIELVSRTPFTMPHRSDSKVEVYGNSSIKYAVTSLAKDMNKKRSPPSITKVTDALSTHQNGRIKSTTVHTPSTDASTAMDKVLQRVSEMGTTPTVRRPDRPMFIESRTTRRGYNGSYRNNVDQTVNHTPLIPRRSSPVRQPLARVTDNRIHSHNAARPPVPERIANVPQKKKPTTIHTFTSNGHIVDLSSERVLTPRVTSTSDHVTIKLKNAELTPKISHDRISNSYRVPLSTTPNGVMMSTRNPQRDYAHPQHFQPVHKSNAVIIRIAPNKSYVNGF